jgi:hypothetical protein
MRIILEEFSCLRCGEKFHSKYKKPLRCGKCKSPYWNRPRRRDGGVAVKSLLAFLALSLAGGVALADEVVLRDGRRIQWKSVSTDGDAYTVETKDGKRFTFRKSEIERFSMEDAAPEGKALTGASFSMDPKRCVTTDLLLKAKVETTNGAWKHVGKTLVNTGENPSRVSVSFDHELPEEYDLTLSIERVSGNFGFDIGIVQGDVTGTFLFDAFNCGCSMFGMIGGQYATKTDGQIFRPGKARTVKVSVRRDAVLVQLDGKDFWKSRLDWKAVTAFGDIPVPEKRRLFVCAAGGSWKVSTVSMTNLK